MISSEVNSPIRRKRLERAILGVLEREPETSFTEGEVREALRKSSQKELARGTLGALAVAAGLDRLVRTGRIRRRFHGPYEVYQKIDRMDDVYREMLRE